MSESSVGADGSPPQLVRFVARFDRREYWLAHEELEALWLMRGDDFYKGLIQVAAAFVHIDRHNWRGAQRLLRTGLAYMEDAEACTDGLDVAAIRDAVAHTLGHVRELFDRGDGSFDESSRIRLAPLFETEVPADIVADVELPYRVARHE